MRLGRKARNKAAKRSGARVITGVGSNARTEAHLGTLEGGGGGGGGGRAGRERRGGGGEGGGGGGGGG